MGAVRFQRTSSKTTLEDPIRLIPSDQAFIDERSTLTSLLGSLRECIDICCFLTSSFPSI
ncbi:hypothetical protein H5410_004199 [Solanum commersonii]|uniref:Uncharacterized protein n=1 Tax=Solanum commersonii TaxID=4109 RepID=A0A9J6B798_SOLCO|nr:hypothetical protein H5410_004199 [Solanum commersonii]